jgi:hypothetical protein
MATAIDQGDFTCGEKFTVTGDNVGSSQAWWTLAFAQNSTSSTCTLTVDLSRARATR